MLYTNIQSLQGHMDQINEQLIHYNPAILLFSETRTTVDVRNSELFIQNYCAVRCDSNSKWSGGVGLYIKRTISFSHYKTLVLETPIPPPPGGTAILPEYIHYYG
jgi:exonuclease III